MELEAQADALPEAPGVYLFKDRHGEVLYVGKANNLRSRVRQYLRGQDERVQVAHLMAAARAVDVVRVHSEKEALLLEASLIRQYMPRFNIRLKDHKGFLHLRIHPTERWPRFGLSRRVREDGARYFGPYHAAGQARNTLQFLQRAFPLRTCDDAVLASRKRPCLLYQIKQCVAPCVGKSSPEQYQAIVGEALLFLQGKNKELFQQLKQRMAAAAEAEDFEEAARLRDLLKALESSLEKQVVADTKLTDRDVWGLYREGDRGVLLVLPVRSGLALAPRAFPFEGEIVPSEELLSSALNTTYPLEGRTPPEILVPMTLPDTAALEEILSERREGKVVVHAPQRGEKVRLLEVAMETAKARFVTTWSEEEQRLRGLEEIAAVVGLEVPPYRIECFDNSNLLGTDPVASQVVFLEGRPAKGEYRTYKVKTVVGADDFATMKEIIGRRMRRALDEGEPPDLIVVDGGRGQLKAALEALAELGLEDTQPIIGLAKPRTEHRRGLKEINDKIVLKDQPEPIVLLADNPGLRILQQIRDEAHRVAIGFHRKQRSASRLKSTLDDIPGVGPTRKKALLTHFGSLAGVKAATEAEIAAVAGIGPELAAAIAAHVRPAQGGA